MNKSNNSDKDLNRSNTNNNKSVTKSELLESMSFIRSSELKTGKIKVKAIYPWEKGGTSPVVTNSSLNQPGMENNSNTQLDNSEVTLHFKMSPMDFSKLQQKRGIGKDLSISDSVSSIDQLLPKFRFLKRGEGRLSFSITEQRFRRVDPTLYTVSKGPFVLPKRLLLKDEKKSQWLAGNFQTTVRSGDTIGPTPYYVLPPNETSLAYYKFRDLEPPRGKPNFNAITRPSGTNFVDKQYQFGTVA